MPGIKRVNAAKQGRHYLLLVQLDRQCETSLPLIPAEVDGLPVRVTLVGHTVTYGAL